MPGFERTTRQLVRFITKKFQNEGPEFFLKQVDFCILSGINLHKKPEPSIEPATCGFEYLLYYPLAHIELN